MKSLKALLLPPLFSAVCLSGAAAPSPNAPPRSDKPDEALCELIGNGARGKWRVNVGASAMGAIRPKMGMNGARMRQLGGFGAQLFRNAAAVSGGRTRSEAFAEGSGAAHGGVRKFDGGAWFDPVDSGTANDPDYSWNWRLHDPSAADRARRGKAFVERTAYDETTETVSFSGDDSFRGHDGGEDFLPGLNAEVACELFRADGRRPWGVDLAAAISCHFQRKVWKDGGEAASAYVERREEKGYWEWWNDSHGEAQYVLDHYRDTQFRDGMWGAGSFEGPGAELAVSPWRFEDVPTASETWTASHSLRWHGDGDYREYAVDFVVRPWWEPCDRLRLFGSVGAELSRREFDWSVSLTGTDGSRFHERGEADDWRVLGLLGGGMSARLFGFVVSGEALWRFGGDDLDVSGRTVNGRIGHGDWGARLSLGYEF